MKLLYLGHYGEGTGWAKSAIDLILASDSANVDVVCRNIPLTKNNNTIHPKLLALESKTLKNIDYCIQHVLPHHMIGTDKFKKNIAYFLGETNTIKYNPWYEYLKMMQYIWVPTNDLKNVLIEDGFAESKISIVPMAGDLSKYTQSYPTINFGSQAYTFKFYYIGELNDRKNLKSIIRCFHSEFDRSEPVSLILKVKKHGLDASQLHYQVAQMCGEVKTQLRIRKDIKDYHNEIIVTQGMSDYEIDVLHNTCDCFVGPSHGEGWSIPAFDAMCFGKTPICSNDGGPKEFIDPNNLNTGSLINGVRTICNHSDPAFPELFTGNEEWFMPSESEIKKRMRFYYENRSSIDRTAGLKNAQKFSYNNVGRIIKDTLNA